MTDEPAIKSDFNDLEAEIDDLDAEIDELRTRMDNRPNCKDEMFGRNFRIVMFLFCLAFVAVAGHWFLAAAGYFAMKDVIFSEN